MTLAELLPSIRQLTDVEKRELFKILGRELPPESSEPRMLSGLEIIEPMEQSFADFPDFELPEIPREPIHTDHTLFGEE